MNLTGKTLVNVMLFFVSTVISIYIAEITIFLVSLLSQIDNTLRLDKMIAKQMISAEDSFDPRDSFDVLMDLRKVGIEAYPFLNSGGNIALSGISKKPTLACEECGYHLLYDSDEHGFNNPKGSWSIGNVEIAVIGDSFVHGFCVKPGEDIPAQLREISGKNTLNLGVRGNDPLSNLAILKEYAEPIRPSVVIWVQFEYDFRDIPREMNNETLLKYLDTEYSRGLINRQSEIDEELIKEALNNIQYNSKRRQLTMQQRSETELRRAASIKTMRGFTEENQPKVQLTPKRKLWQKLWQENQLIKIAKLSYLRQRLESITMFLPSYSNQFFKIFREILETAKNRVHSWHGKLYFVYLPSIDRYNMKGVAPCWRQEVLAIARSLDIPIIDMQDEVFAVHPDPLALFPFRVGVHYNAEGYRLVAQAIVSRLKKDKLLR